MAFSSLQSFSSNILMSNDKNNLQKSYVTITTTGNPTHKINGTLGEVNSYYTVTSANTSNTVTYTFNNPKSTTKIRLLAVGGGGNAIDEYGRTSGPGGGGGGVLDISFNLNNAQIQTITVSDVSMSNIDTIFSMSNSITGTYKVGKGGAPYINPDLYGRNGGSNAGNLMSSSLNNQLYPAVTFTINGVSVTIQGNIGGKSFDSGTSYNPGGGGAGGPGGHSLTATSNGVGGIGKISNITGTNVSYGYGGSGGNSVVAPTSGPGIFIMRILSV